MKIFASLLFTLLNTCLLFAQYEYPAKEYCEEIKSRILAVQLLEGKNPNEQYLNKALKKAFSEWNITPVEFKTWQEIAIIIDDSNTDYAILMQEDKLRDDIRMHRVDESGKKVFSYSPNSGRNYYTNFSFAYHNFNLLLPTDKKLKEVSAIGFANSDLSIIDYTFLLQQLNLLVSNSLKETNPKEYSNAENNLEKLKGLKLAILQDYFKLKDIEDIVEEYDHEYTMVDFNTYQDIILNKDEGVAYTKFIWSNHAKTYVLAAVEASSGRIIGQVEFDKTKMKKDHKAEGVLDPKDIHSLSHLRIQKGNNYYK